MGYIVDPTDHTKAISEQTGRMATEVYLIEASDLIAPTMAELSEGTFWSHADGFGRLEVN